MAVGAVLLLVVLTGLVLAIAAADRRFAARAQDRVAQGLREQLVGVQEPVDVDLGDGSVLPQLVRGRLDRVEVALGGVTLSGVPVRDVQVTAHDVTTRGTLTAGGASVSATLPTSSLQTLVDEHVGDGLEVTVSAGALVASTTVLGVDLAVDLRPRAQDGAVRADVLAVRLGPAELDVADLPDALAGRLRDLTLPVEDLPAPLVLTEVEVVDDGLRLVAVGTDVPLETAAGRAPTGTP